MNISFVLFRQASKPSMNFNIIYRKWSIQQQGDKCLHYRYVNCYNLGGAGLNEVKYFFGQNWS